METVKKPLRILFIPVITLLLTLFAAEMLALGEPVRETTADAAAAGNVIVSVPGFFDDKDMETAVDLVNEIRLEACQNGYVNPDTGAPLTMADYVPVSWSGDLEWVAQTRAAEAMVFFDHTRPNGKNFRSVTYNGVGADLEILAGGVNTVKGAISSWYSEKKYWVNRDTSEATGHYTTMIRPSMLYMGLGCFTNNLGASRSWAGEFSGQAGLRSYRQNFHGDCIQKMEVDASKLGNPVVKADDSLTGIMIGSTTKLVAYDSVDYGNFLEEPIPVLAAQVPGWSSSKPGVAKVSADGVVKGLKAGTAVVSATFRDGRVGKITIVVFAPQVGSIVEEGNGYYRITQLGKTAEYYAGGDGPTVSIPDTVRIIGKKYKVTSIGNRAFSGKTNLVSVKIGSNVTGIGNEAFAGCVNLKSVVIPAKVRSIGLKAFYGCANLRTVTIRTGKLTAGNIGKKAFAKTGIKTVKTPKGKAKAYRALLRKKGLGKKAKVK